MSIGWRVEFFDDSVQGALEAMAPDIRASFLRIVNLIESHGLENVREPYVKHLQGPLWEMRMKGKDGIARAAYVTATGRRVVVVHVFAKKTQKTPSGELRTALVRAKEVE
jgi:phage-related protein